MRGCLIKWGNQALLKIALFTPRILPLYHYRTPYHHTICCFEAQV
jgi:hypothetical protein